MIGITILAVLVGVVGWISWIHFSTWFMEQSGGGGRTYVFMLSLPFLLLGIVLTLLHI